jgi:hypothetical protein
MARKLLRFTTMLAVPALALGVWNGLGLVAGIPADALTWLGVGAALASVSCAPRRVY